MLTRDEHERLIIRDAMKRLLDGEPIRSDDGKLTVKSLAIEAQVKRWLLTHKHTDLRDEFYEKVRLQNATPTAIRELREHITALEEAREDDRVALRDADEEIERMARELAVLALENAQLRERLADGLPPRIRPLRGGNGPSSA